MARGWFVPLLLVCACYQRVEPIRTVETGDAVAFELSALAHGATNGSRQELLELMVTKRNCSSDCMMWFIQRATTSPCNVPLTRARIRYGATVSATLVRTPARALEPGRYAVDATVQQYGASGELLRSVSMAGDFAIERDGDGKPRLAGSADKAGGAP